MYIIIPENINGLAAIIDKLDELDFRNFNRSEQLAHLCMSKFKIESQLDLIPTFNDVS